MSKYQDGEIVGLSGKGHLMKWDDGLYQIYSTRETIEQFGAENISEQEWARLPAEAQALKANH
ncbi:MAG: hypothetical protein RSD49_08075 [Hafnia sp.]